MSSEYPLLPLGKVASVRSGYAFKSADMCAEGHPLIKIRSIVPPRVDISLCDRISKEVIGRTPGAERYLLKEGDILIAMTGATAGKTGRFPATNEECFLNQRVGKVYPLDNSSIDQEYLYQVLSRQGFADEILSLADGSAQGNVSGALIETYKVPIPPLQIQKAIAHILGTVDDKIELNRKTNETLEAMAKALFKSWFVDFDPVRAKAEGRPTGLPAEISDLFPDSFEESELGEIPSGWEVKSLDEVAHFLNGLALQKFPPEDGKPTLPVIKIAQLKKGDSIGADRCSTAVPSDYVVSDGDVLFSWSGSLAVDIWCGGDGALNQHLFKVTSKTNDKWFFLHWVKHHLPEFQEIAQGKATTMGHIQRHHLSEAKALIPTPSLLAAMDSAFAPLLDRAYGLRKQSKDLATTRDALFPKLISGEIRIPDAEKMLEEVGV
jgi:type I restriction enzyme S subunit